MFPPLHSPRPNISLSNPASWFRYWDFHTFYQPCSSSVNLSAIKRCGSSVIAKKVHALSHSCCADLNSCSQVIQLSQIRKSLKVSRKNPGGTSSSGIPDKFLF